MRERPQGDAPRVRAKYLTGSLPANDTANPMVLMSMDQMLDAITMAVTDAIAEATPRLLNKQGLAERLCCSVGSVSRLLARGCPHVKVGDNSPRFIYEDVISWLGCQQPKESA